VTPGTCEATRATPVRELRNEATLLETGHMTCVAVYVNEAVFARAVVFGVVE